MTFAPAAVLEVIDVLNDIGAPYMVTGSLARNVYCVPRSTVDADFVAELTAAQFKNLAEKLKQHFEQESQMAFETVTGKVQHRFRHRDSKFLVEVFEANMSDPHEQMRFQRRRAIEAEGRRTFVPTPEDIIIQKLRWYGRIQRKKDRDDVLDVMHEQWGELDWSHLERWCAEHGTLDELNTLRDEVEAQINADR